jgi:hypothetical protein
MRKGQLFSGDIAIATFVFLSSLALALFMWNSTTEDINRAEELRNIQKIAFQAVEQLVRTPGTPEDWNYFTVEVPGLSSEDRIINQTKALAFMQLMDSNISNYEDNKHLVSIDPYEFYMNVTYLDGSAVEISGDEFVAGRVPTDEVETLAIVRTAIFNSTIIRLNFIVWR